jgi:WD40 repeat protein
VTGLKNGTIELLQSGIHKQVFKGHTNWVNAVRFARNFILSASNDKTVRVWSIEQRCLIHSFSNHSNNVTRIFALENNLFVSGSHDHSMIMWDLSTLTLNSILRSEAVSYDQIVFDNTFLIYPSGNSLKIWSTDSNSVQSQFIGHSDTVCCVAKDADFIVSAQFVCGVCGMGHKLRFSMDM